MFGGWGVAQRMTGGRALVDDAHSLSRHRLGIVVGESLRVDDEAAHWKRDRRRQARGKGEQLVGVAVGHHEELVLELRGRQEQARGDIARHDERGVGDVHHDGGRRGRAHGDPDVPLASTPIPRTSAAKTAEAEGWLRVA